MTSQLHPSKSNRTCVGCGEAIDSTAEHGGSGSVRLVRGPDGAIAVDAKGGAFGRGAHVHTRPACIAKAAERGLARSFKAACAATAVSLAADIAAALDRRIEGLLVSAVRSRAIGAGPDGDAEVFVTLAAVDASTEALLELAPAIAAGRAVAWGTSAMLAALATKGGAPQNTIAITSEKIASALAEAVRAKDAALTASAQGEAGPRSRSADRFSSRRARGVTAREAASPGSTNQSERGA